MRRDATPGPLPTFLILGAQKSGTTSLIHYLGGHPDVHAIPYEVHFFDRAYERGLDWYRTVFREARDEREVGEATPVYLYDERVPERVARDLPDVRLIAILRDPVSRAYSHYWHNRTRGNEPLSFEDALDAEAGRLTDADPFLRARYAYVGRGLYREQLERYRSQLPDAPLFVSLFEDLRRDRLALVQSLFRFLGVDPEVVPETIDAVKNRFMTFRSQRVRSAIRKLPAPLRRVPGRLNVRYATYPPMSQAVRERLRARFREPNRDLARWLARDLSEWGA